MAVKAEEAATVEVATFKRADIIKSKKYANDRDLIMALLSANGEYSLKQVDDMIIDFKKREVK